jgi:hypothetical protein
LIAKLRKSGKATQYNGNGAWYIEFGGGRIVSGVLSAPTFFLGGE